MMRAQYFLSSNQKVWTAYIIKNCNGYMFSLVFPGLH